MIDIKIIIAAILLGLLGCKTESDQPLSVHSVNVISVDTSKTLSRIAFGSCSDEDEPQPIWKYIVSNEADLWIWLGDMIYGDSDNPKVLEEKYNEQLANLEYQKLLSSTAVIGIWDDHDYGENDGDKNFAIKKESKELMVNFLNIDKDADVRKREGAYQSYTFGEGEKKVKILLLDGRYFRDELKNNIVRSGQRYHKNEAGDILGEAQWKWLENELSNSDAAIHIIGCGIQVVPVEHNYEKWANFPMAHQRLYNLLNQTQPSRAILLSGDRHIAEISSIQLDSLDYPLYDITSSGLTHSYEKVDQNGEPNQYRVNNILSGQKNFAQLEIDWSVIPPNVKAEIRGLGNHIIYEHQLYK